MNNFTFNGPLGPIECVVEANRSKNNAVLVMAHGFRGSRDSGGRALGVAQQAAAGASVVRFNFTGTRILSLQVAELRAVLAEVRRRWPGCMCAVSFGPQPGGSGVHCDGGAGAEPGRTYFVGNAA